jgi:N-acyl-D-amino-acid deacylase
MAKKTFICIIFFFLLGAEKSTLKAQSWDLLIHGGILVDGTGSAPYKADILIKSDSIAKIGEINKDSVLTSKKIDASGKIVSPGSIDMHAHGNPLQTPEFLNFLAMGVTTIVLGQDGSSVTFGSYEDWFSKVSEINPGVNIATLAGHGSLRNSVNLSDDVEVYDKDIKRMEKALSKTLEAGAYGMSLGLEYVPGLFAEEDELKRLAEVVGEYDGIIISHMRSEDNSKIQASLEELAVLGKYARVQASHLKVVYGKGEKRAEEILNILETYRSKGIPFSADTYPYAASYTGIGIVFPEWVKTEKDWKQAIVEKPKVLRTFLKSKVDQRNGPEAILFGNGVYAGMTLKQASELEKKDPIDLLLEMGPRGASAAHFVMNEVLQDRIAVDEHVMISSDGSPTMRHPRGYGSFAKVIRKYVVEEERLSIQSAVEKMSALPAKTLGLTDRGQLKEGFKADIIIFDPSNVHDLANFEDPHQLAEGFDWVVVNGKVS